VRRLRTLRGELEGPSLATPAGSFQRGDRIICRHNDRALDIDNGTRGTVMSASPALRRLEIRADDGRRLTLPRAYVDAGHVEHAYALTAHSLQGATLEAACVVSRPDDHDTRWTYTACSRARGATEHVLIDDAPRDPRTRGSDLIARLLEAMARDAADELATEHLPTPRHSRPAAEIIAPSRTTEQAGLEIDL
jgi:hypothetical protein